MHTPQEKSKNNEIQELQNPSTDAKKNNMLELGKVMHYHYTAPIYRQTYHNLHGMACKAN